MRLLKSAVKALVCSAVLLLCVQVSVAAAVEAPNWWDHRSLDERRAIVDYLHVATGHPAPFGAQAAAGQSLFASVQFVGADDDVASGELYVATHSALLPPMSQIAGQFGTYTEGRFMNNVSVSSEIGGEMVFVHLQTKPLTVDVGDFDYSKHLFSVPAGFDMYANA